MAVQQQKKFPREDRFPKQYSEAWTQCARCKTELRCYDEQTTLYLDDLPYCKSCYEKVKGQ
ncbi:MAG: hypothetical protein HYY67_08340 [Thaumarchaeota archaeon]|nr:hypothetical protein [Nitrososphaerota archaeon]